MEAQDLLARINREGLQHRTAQIETRSIDEKARRVTLALSSEKPYQRWFGFEILGHSTGEVGMDWLSSGSAPFLDSHSTRQQIGVIEKAWIDSQDRKIRAVVRFSRNPAADEIFQDVLDGIKKSVSVGYSVESMTLVSENAKEGKTYRVDRWTPLEASVVAIPADMTVGVGKNHDSNSNHFEENSMLSENEKKHEREKELARIREITALGAHPQGNFQKAAEKAVKDGQTVGQFRAFVLDELKKRAGGQDSAVNPDPRIGLSSRANEEETTPLRDAIFAGCPEFQTTREAGRARELHQALSRSTGRTAKGLLIDLGTPLRNERSWSRGLGTDGISAGGALVGTTMMPIIDSLTSAAFCIKAGAQVVQGLVGDVAYPRVDADLSATWIGEHDEATESNPQFGQLRMTPKTLSARCIISRRLLLQTAGTAEQVVKDIISRQFGIALDAAVLNGAGTPNVPRGILQTPGIGSVTLNAANAPDWGDIIDLETAVAVDNALDGSLAYMTNATISGAMKKTDKGTDTGKFLLEAGKANNYPVLVSNNVPAKHLVFGNWADVLIGMWSGMDVLVDPYTRSAQAEIVVQAFIDVDVILRHPESFADGYAA